MESGSVATNPALSLVETDPDSTSRTRFHFSTSDWSITTDRLSHWLIHPELETEHFGTERLTDLGIYYRGVGDFVTTYLVNNTPIYMSYCSFLVLGWLLDTGSNHCVVED